MIYLLALLAFIEVGTASIANYTEYNFTQVVDHFDILSTETFEQRYLLTGEPIDYMLRTRAS